MLIYIRDINTFSVISMHECGEWRVALDIRTNSSFTVPGELYDLEGQLICSYDVGTQQGYAGVINALSVANGSTMIQAAPLISLFDADYAIPRGSIDKYATGCVGLCWDVITANHVNTTDSVYKYPWLIVYYGNDPRKAPPELNNAGLFNLRQYIIDRVNAGDMMLEIWVNNANISIAFGTSKLNDSYIYDMTTGRHQLQREAYSRNVVARITTHTSDESEPPVWTERNYYFLTDGTYTENAAASNRARGVWRHLYNPEDTDVEDTFKANQYKAEVEFYSKELPQTYYDSAKAVIKLPNGRIIKTVITGISKSSSDDRFRITTGMVVSNTRAYIEAAFNTAQKAAAELAANRRT